MSRTNRAGRRGKGKAERRDDPATRAFSAGLAKAMQNPALRALDARVLRTGGTGGTRADGSRGAGAAGAVYSADTGENSRAPAHGLARVDSYGTVHAHPTRRAEPAEWTWAVAHCLLHLGFGHAPAARGERTQPDRYEQAARCAVVNRFLVSFGTGRPPAGLPEQYPGGTEEELAARWRRDGIPAEYEHCGAAGGEPDVLLLPWDGWPGTAPPDWQQAFAHALTRTMSAAMEVAGGRRDSLTGARVPRRPWERALEWFVSSYPLLGGVAAGMTVVADAELARAHDISVAAVDAAAGEIYINPLKDHTDEEWRFILGHEMLHAALRHGERRGARDPYLFNIAADFVVNGWLLEMGVGEMPPGLLYDPRLAGLSTEEVYDRLAADLRVQRRRLATPRGRGLGDVLGEPLVPRDPAAAYTDLDEFYRRGLQRGLDLHERDPDRGLLPAGLVEEIRALAQPPLPWDARLARWFDEFVPRAEPVRTFARPARRQAATPDIPRAGRYFPPEEIARCTFGVVLDTSGSMNRTLLGKALGAIASYAEARDVPAARVVFCDARPYDAGYLPATEIAGRVRVRGRGGTELQPGVDLLERADDFPRAAPVLVITDGRCDVLRVRREHAYLVPAGASLPFVARGPVFRVR
ncbi:vWA domain-containing protein [Streptomyces synnematoformans]|uniref:Putative metallopeptidase domain-containing protein n=1 Tax=Streptomyces synnematoformans TaxID=415721 RepID=A0ABP5K3G4_9ACTN